MKTFSTKTSKLLSGITLMAASLLLSASANATTFTSAKSGAWTDPATWSISLPTNGNTIPGDGDFVIIGGGKEHLITLNGNVTVATLAINAADAANKTTKLTLGGATITLTANDVEINGGTNDKKIAELDLAGGTLSILGNQNNLRVAQNTNSFLTFNGGKVVYSAPLPVSLTSFKAAKTENGTALTWETASEKNNKGYDVQASADGKNFETVAFVASKNGNANYSQRYEFLDKTSRSGLVYYRLKQTDFDGTVAFYAAKVVDLGKFAESAVAYPNPFQNQFEVKLNGATSLEVTDLTGKIVYRGQIAPGAKNLNIDMNNQPAGIYLLKASAGSSTEISRLIKQ